MFFPKLDNYSAQCYLYYGTNNIISTNKYSNYCDTINNFNMPIVNVK